MDNNKLIANIGIAIGLLTLSILFAFVSDWADDVGMNAVAIVGFFGAVFSLVGCGLASVAAYWEWMNG